MKTCLQITLASGEIKLEPLGSPNLDSWLDDPAVCSVEILRVSDAEWTGRTTPTMCGDDRRERAEWMADRRLALQKLGRPDLLAAHDLLTGHSVSPLRLDLGSDRDLARISAVRLLDDSGISPWSGRPRSDNLTVYFNGGDGTSETLHIEVCGGRILVDERDQERIASSLRADGARSMPDSEVVDRTNALSAQPDGCDLWKPICSEDARVGTQPAAEPDPPEGEVALATCQHGSNLRRADGPNTFAAALVHAGIVSLRDCRCEWCTKFPNAIGAHAQEITAGDIAHGMGQLDEAMARWERDERPPEGTIRADDVPGAATGWRVG